MKTLSDLMEELKDLMTIPEENLETDPVNPFTRYYNSNDPVVSIVSGDACDLLITDTGACNWDNIHQLQEEGFKVYAGDKDSFGWLTGCISIRKSGEKFNRILVYG